ncbi:MAG: hypothetical protein FWG09_07195 [Synergistaceae bacterium]|nr:hypothetical protein [Synergistaceae bacterium]
MPEEELLNGDSNEAASIEEDEASYPRGEELPYDADDEDVIPYPIEEEKIYAAVKGIFYTPKADNSGAFCVIYKGDTGKIIFRELWGVRSNNKPASDIFESWENFIKDMNKIGAYDRDSSEKLMPLIEQAFGANIIEYLYKNIDETETLHTEIRKELENSLRYLVEVEIHGELFGNERAEKGGLLRDGDKKEEPAAEPAQEDNSESLLGVLNLGGFPLMCQPIINPVNGCPVSRIKIGDMVHVMIPESNDVAKKVMDFVRLQGLEAAFPVTIIQTMESGSTVIVLKINEEINGVLNLSSDMMLKTDVQHSQTGESAFSLLKERILNPANLILLGLLFFIVLLLYVIGHFVHF